MDCLYFGDNLEVTFTTGPRAAQNTQDPTARPRSLALAGETI